MDDEGRDMLRRGVASPSGVRFCDAVAGRLRKFPGDAAVEGDAATFRVREAVEGRGGRMVPAPRRTVGIADAYVAGTTLR